MKNASSKITLLLLCAVVLLFAGCTTTTPLIDAARRGDTKEMERLIAEGADVNEKVLVLIEKGADVNAKKYYIVATPLYYAAFLGHVDLVRMLIKNGADPNIAYVSGETPLSIAKERGHTSIVSLLEQAKPEPSSPAEEAAFTEAARGYRVATVKPTLPEEARKFKVQAEFAFNKKEFEGAAARYKEALDAAPWWPEGHFNRALILGELFRYHDAIREMKRYLTLVPDAPNARAAQDKIYQWEGELK